MNTNPIVYFAVAGRFTGMKNKWDKGSELSFWEGKSEVILQPSRTGADTTLDVFINGKFAGYLFATKQEQIAYLTEQGWL